VARETNTLKAKVEAAVLAEMERAGPDAFRKVAVVNRFMGQGASRATLYRWVDAPLASGRVGQHLTRKVKEAAAKRARRSPEPAREVAAERGGSVCLNSVSCLISGASVLFRLPRCAEAG